MCLCQFQVYHYLYLTPGKLYLPALFMQGGCFMHSLSDSSQGNTYTIKWMFGLPEVMKAMHDMDIHEGSTIRVLQKFRDSLIISSADRKIVLGNEVADRIQV